MISDIKITKKWSCNNISTVYRLMHWYNTNKSFLVILLFTCSMKYMVNCYRIFNHIAAIKCHVHGMFDCSWVTILIIPDPCRQLIFFCFWQYMAHRIIGEENWRTKTIYTTFPCVVGRFILSICTEYKNIIFPIWEYFENISISTNNVLQFNVS